MAKIMSQFINAGVGRALYHDGTKRRVIAWATYVESGFTKSDPGYAAPPEPQKIGGLVWDDASKEFFFADELEGFVSYIFD